MRNRWKHWISNTCFSPQSSSFFYVSLQSKRHKYTTAQQSILSLISHYSISWCVMCYRWYIHSHSPLCATGPPLSMWTQTFSLSPYSKHTYKQPLLWTHFLLVHTTGCTPRLWIIWSVSLIVYAAFTHESWVFSCVFVPRVRWANISLSAGSFEIKLLKESVKNKKKNNAREDILTFSQFGNT